MFKAVTGQAEGVDTNNVIEIALNQCKEQLGEMSPIAGLLFLADHLDHHLAIAEIKKVFPGIALAGCTSGGEMSSSMGFSHYSLCLTLLVSDTVEIASGIAPNLSQNPEIAAREAIQTARDKLHSSPKLCLVFPGILTVGFNAFLKSIHNELNGECLVFGGMAGGSEYALEQLRQFSDSGIFSDSVSVLLFSGPLKIISRISNSWKPVGAKSVVTKGTEEVIERIGKQEALQFYRDAFGKYSEPLPEMPLAIYDDKGRFYLRSAKGFDEQKGSVSYTTPIREGRIVQLTEALPTDILSSLDDDLNSLVKDIGEDWSSGLALLFSCTSRGWILGQRTSKEIESATAIFPEHIPVAGFYTFGEIATEDRSEPPRLHNCTLVSLLLGEENGAEGKRDSPIRFNPKAASPKEDPELLKIKLEQARESQAHLEMQKESFTNMQRKMGEDLTRANKQIQETNLFLKQSLTLAQEVQQNLLPHTAPTLGCLDIAAKSLYCDETGGDYFDYHADKNYLNIILGDVSGHGISAALLMSTARALLRMRMNYGGSPSEIVKDVNHFLTSDVKDTGRFMTLFLLRVNLADRNLSWVKAGHEPGIRYSPETTKFEELRGKGIALGVASDLLYEEYHSSPLNKGEIILLGTDGLTEARSINDEYYGKNRLKMCLKSNSHLSAQQILESCLQDISNFREGKPREDDETLIIIKAL